MTFIQLLQQSCGLPFNDQVFQQGYSRALDIVSEEGVYEFFGLKIVAPPGVYSPHDTSSTRFFLSHFPSLGLDCPPAGGQLLEVGCGAGAISILAAKHGWHVTATDIDAKAVEATQRNAQNNGVEVETLVSDLLSAVPDRRFDVIVFNQPYYHVDRDIEATETTLANPSGSLYVTFMAQAAKALKPTGFVAVTYANFSRQDLFTQEGWSYACCAFEYAAVANTIRSVVSARRVDRSLAHSHRDVEFAEAAGRG